MTETVTHVAGIEINIAGRVIQRCMVCGAKLLDSKGEMVPLGSRPAMGFTTGRFVRITPGNPKSIVMLEDTGKMPTDGCIALIED